MNPQRKAKLLNYFYVRDSRLLFVLFTSRWFRYSFALCLSIAIGVPIAVTKFIPATKPGFRPEIHISLLDWIQSEALARTARKAVDSAQPTLAFSSWRTAIGNNPGRADFNRDYLKALVRMDKKRDHWKDATRTTFWLLHLSNTNQSDLELAAKTFETYRLDQLVIQSIDAYSGKQSIELSRSYLRALFRTGQDDAFRDHWRVAPAGASNDPTMELYQVAFNASQGNASQVSQARTMLEQAGTDPQFHLISKQLQLHICHRQGDLKTFETLLITLIENFNDSISDHLLYWDLLKKSGRVELARARAKEFILPPQTGFQVVKIADAYTSLALPELAISYLKNFSGEYGFQAQSQYAQASLLIAEERWPDVHQFALEIRNSEKTSAPFLAFSYYLEGLSAIRRGRTQDANVAFQKIRNYSMEGSNLGLYVGSNLWDLGYLDEAYAVLSPERQRYANNLTYWQLMLELSKSNQTAIQMLIAAENLFRLSPDHLPNQINYASLLISQRTQLERALSLTFDALIKAPNSLPVQINYAQALAITGRPDKAAQILSSIDSNHFDTTQWQGFAFAWLTVHHQKKDAKKIQSIAKRVIPDLLLPGDRKYFEVIVQWARNHEDSAEALIGING
ncbi:MAG: hypothetical protein HOI66_16465 [Verrucomicrobia bacterium]|jgi:thioredoxin-like negative regulator of GroEL|nr:hypothetical protein [Verrucomicrobiota bacterium]